MYSFNDRKPCRYGAQCRKIDDSKHSQEFNHPPYCTKDGDCQDTTDNHERAYGHLPMCKDSHKYKAFMTRINDYFNANLRSKPHCSNGSHCINFHNKNHIEKYTHPFPTPCPFTPYHCKLFDQLVMTKNHEGLSDEVYQHCRDFAHVCHFGRCCTTKDTFHLEKTIHIFRPLCPDDIQCTKLVQEDHLNSFTHSNIRDIRLLCKHGNKCFDRHKIHHLTKYRHAYSFGNTDVVCYYGLNKGINFVQNQQDNIERINNYIKNQNWESLSSKSISQDIIDWIHTVQPVHRCKPEIFESILIHGHVMSRDYMKNLKKPEYVVHSILQHYDIRRIEILEDKIYEDLAREYITELVMDVFENKDSNRSTEDSEPPSPDTYDSQSRKKIITKKKISLLQIISQDELQVIESTAYKIAKASIELHSNPAGIGYKKDVDLGTNRTVFSVLGPHSGKYGNIFIVFKREILHHSDANFSIQSATSYASGNAFTWRPWLGKDPVTDKNRIELFHKTKLHASIPGYEYATALELIAIISHNGEKKTMNINLETLLDGWKELDSHKRIEAHLPQLIPLDYIEHIYMTNSIFKSFDMDKQKTIKDIFQSNISVVSYPSQESYEEFVSNELITKFGQRDTHSFSRPIRGSVITITSTHFKDQYVLPLTISQAFEQYKTDNLNALKDSTIYIYWQVMNGDMMLTLSNEQIDPNRQQPNLKCLICYLAEKPSTKDARYHEHVSYLNSGRPLQHYIFINKGTYAAKTTAFYLGCNTDDLMTFRLEIRRSTGKVILSHSGPNLIYNQETISCTFAKRDLDLNQLNFIHVSAGARTVPIRNLYITFKKEPEPFDSFDSTTENIQFRSSSDQTSNWQRQSTISTSSNVFPEFQLIKWLLIYVFTLYTIFTLVYMFPKGSTSIPKDNSSFSLWNFISYPIRYGWMIIFIGVGEYLQKKDKFPEYVRLYQKIMTVIVEWCDDDDRKYWIVIIGVLAGPFLLETCIIWLIVMVKFITFVLWKLVTFFIRYEWMVIVIIISEVLKNQNRNSDYGRLYEKIRNACHEWCNDDNNIKRWIVIIGVLAGPFLLETCIIWLMPMIQFIIFALWKLIMFIVRYEWVVIVIIINEILKDQNWNSDYIRLYGNIRNACHEWCDNNNIKHWIVFIGVLAGPFLLETCITWFTIVITFVLFLLWKLILFITRYFWILIVIGISEILSKNNQCQDYIRVYRSILRQTNDWCGDNTVKRGIVIIFVLTGPYLLELLRKDNTSTL